MKKKLIALLLSTVLASAAVMPAMAAESDPVIEIDMADETELQDLEDASELTLDASMEEADIQEDMDLVEAADVEDVEIIAAESEEDIEVAEDEADEVVIEAIESEAGDLEEVSEEAGDVAITTGKIKWGQLYKPSATEDMADREVWYDMTLPRSGRLKIAFTCIESEGWSYDRVGYITIYTTSEKKLFETSVDLGKSKIDTVDLDAGDYLVKTNVGGNNVFKMQFKIDFENSKETVIDSVLDPHNSVLNAAAYKPKSKSYGIDGYITINGRDDYFQFKVSKNSIVNLAFKTTQLHDIYYTVYNKEGGEVESKRGISVGTNSYDIPLKKGSYYIKIGADEATGKYNFRISEKAVPKPAITSLKQEGSFLVPRWKERSLVDGYELQISTSKKFTKSTTNTVTANSNYKNYLFSWSNVGLKSGKTYYIRMRYIYDVGDSTFTSAWSKVVSKKYKAN